MTCRGPDPHKELGTLSTPNTFDPLPPILEFVPILSPPCSTYEVLKLFNPLQLETTNIKMILMYIPLIKHNYQQNKITTKINLEIYLTLRCNG